MPITQPRPLHLPRTRTTPIRRIPVKLMLIPRQIRTQHAEIRLGVLDDIALRSIALAGVVGEIILQGAAACAGTELAVTDHRAWLCWTAAASRRDLMGGEGVRVEFVTAV